MASATSASAAATPAPDASPRVLDLAWRHANPMPVPVNGRVGPPSRRSTRCVANVPAKGDGAMAGNGRHGWAAVTGSPSASPAVDRRRDDDRHDGADRRRGHRRRPAGARRHRRPRVPSDGRRADAGAVDDRRGDGLAAVVRRHRRSRRRHRRRHGWRAAAAIHAGQARAVLCVTAARRQRRAAAQPKRSGQSAGRDTSAWAEFEVPFGNVGANVGTP